MSGLSRLWIEGPAGRLETLLRVASPARAAAVIAHPHPLYGGTMHNPVVFHCDRELHRAGLTTLRFNFRGVGASHGNHDGGRGEVHDVGAAFAKLTGVAAGRPVLAVGYSFGSTCAFRFAATEPRVRAVVAVGLPVRLFPGEELPPLGRPLAVVQGSEDEFGSPEQVRACLAELEPPARITVIDGASHLFVARARDAAKAVVEAALTLLSDQRTTSS